MTDDDAVVPVDPSDVTPARVTLADLARVSAATPEPTLADAHAARVAALRLPRHATPAGLPRGAQWLPPDTGKLGYAAARRRAQAERRAAKLARHQ